MTPMAASQRVVVIDRDEGVLLLCEQVLARAGYEVAIFSHADEALAHLQRHVAGAVVVSAEMAVMNGFALLEKARFLRPALAVVILSRYGTIEDAVEALNYGADGLLLKPFERVALVESVRRAMAHRQRQEETARVAALRPLLGVAEALISELNPQSLRALIVQKVREVLPSSSVGLYVWEGENDDGEVLASIGEVFSPHDPLWLSEVLRERPWQLDRQSTTDEAERLLLKSRGWDSVLIAEAPHEPRRYAILVARQSPPAFHEAVDGVALGILVRLAAAALENARLYEELQESVNKLRRSQQALAQAEKMAAIGRLTGSLAHEVNNPIQAVRNSLYLASHPHLDEAKRQQYLRTAAEEVERLSTLVHRMLNFYRPGRAMRREVSLGKLAHRVVKLLATQLEEQHIEVVVDIPPELPPVWGVEDQLQQVLLNLVLNAMEAMRQGGRLFLLGWVEGQTVVLAVEDTGPGIAEEVSDRLFEPLVSTKEGGTGLGLAVSYNIVADHGGQLLLSRPRRGSGAAFRIVLPCPKLVKAGSKGG